MLSKKIKKLFSENLIWIILFACVVCFLALAEDVFTHEIMNGDVIGYKFTSKYLINDSLTPFIKDITWFGGAISLIIITVIIFIFIRNKKIGFAIATNLVIITIINQALKFLLDRKSTRLNSSH